MEFEGILEQVRRRVVRKHGDALLSANGTAYQAVTDAIRRETRSVLKREDPAVEEKVVAYLVGLGPVDALLKDPDVSEVMINRHDEIYVERNGRIEKTDLAYRDEEEVLNVLYRIVQRCGRKVNFSSPLVDARLPDGSRVNAVIPPASLNPVILSCVRTLGGGKTEPFSPEIFPKPLDNLRIRRYNKDKTTNL